MTGVGVYATVRWSAYWLILVGLFAIAGTLCAASAVAVFIEPRQVASREARDAYRAQHGSLY